VSGILRSSGVHPLPDYLGDDEYRAFQKQLGLGSDTGDLMPGTGGFQEIRWADKWRGKGRRGGLRTLYGKNEAADLTPGEKEALKAAIESDSKARETAKRKR
jgi:hypothetical protein